MLSIIIVNYKTPDMLRLCIKSLIATIKTTPYEIIVVDSATDGELEDQMAEEFPKIKFFAFEDNLGYSKSVNAGIKKASGEYILVLNPDIIAEDEAVDKMLAYIKSHHDAGMVGPRLLNFNGTPQNSAFRFYGLPTIIIRRTFLGKMEFGKKRMDRFLLKDKNIEHIKEPLAVDWLMGSALMVSKKALEKTGGMDEQYFMYFEDVDWARTFWENGFKVVYLPQAKMHHYHGQTSKRLGLLDVFLNKMTWVHLNSAYKYFKKYGIKTKHYV